MVKKNIVCIIPFFYFITAYFFNLKFTGLIWIIYNLEMEGNTVMFSSEIKQHYTIDMWVNLLKRFTSMKLYWMYCYWKYFYNGECAEQ